MTPLELHIKLDVSYSQLNSNANLQVLPEIKDMILNQAVLEYIDSVLNPLQNKKYIQFDNAIKNDYIQTLITDKILPVYISNIDNTINQLLSYIDTEVDGLYHGFTFLPENYRYYGKSMLYYKGDECTTPIVPDNRTYLTKYTILKMKLYDGSQSIEYTYDDVVIDLLSDFAYTGSDYDANQHYFSLINHILYKYRNFIDNGNNANFKKNNRLEIGYRQLDDIYVSDAIIIKHHIYGEIDSPLADTYTIERTTYGTVSRTFEEYIEVYHISAINEKTNGIDGYSLGVLTDIDATVAHPIYYTMPMPIADMTEYIEGQDEINNTKIQDYLAFHNIPSDNHTEHNIFTVYYSEVDDIVADKQYIFKQHDTVPLRLCSLTEYGDISEIFERIEKVRQREIDSSLSLTGTAYTPCDLQTNVDVMNGIHNHYYNKNIIRNVPVSIKENTLFIKNITPTYIPIAIRLNYIRTPIKIDYQLNQMCELTNYDDIVSIASRIMTSYVNNQNEYQIKLKENHE